MCNGVRRHQKLLISILARQSIPEHQCVGKALKGPWCAEAGVPRGPARGGWSYSGVTFPGEGPRARTPELQIGFRGSARGGGRYKKNTPGSYDRPRAEGGDTKKYPGELRGSARGEGRYKKNTKPGARGGGRYKKNTKQIRTGARGTWRYKKNTTARGTRRYKKIRKNTIPPGEPWGLSAWGHASPRLAVRGWLSGAGRPGLAGWELGSLRGPATADNSACIMYFVCVIPVISKAQLLYTDNM